MKVIAFISFIVFFAVGIHYGVKAAGYKSLNAVFAKKIGVWLCALVATLAVFNYGILPLLSADHDLLVIGGVLAAIGWIVTTIYVVGVALRRLDNTLANAPRQ